MEWGGEREKSSNPNAGQAGKISPVIFGGRKRAKEVRMRATGGRMVFAAVVPLLAAGCALVQLRDNLERLDQAGQVGGTVVAEPAGDHPICVALFKEAPAGAKNELAAYQVAYGSAAFHFVQPPGRYWLIAFEDANEDGTFQPSERVGWHGEPTLVELEPGADLQGLELVLRMPERARRELPDLYANAAPRVPLQLENRHVGTVADLDAPRFDPEEGLLGMWGPVDFLRKHGAGLFFLEPYDPARIPVLFVHGMGGTPRNFRHLIDGLDRSRFQACVAHYPTGLRLPLLARWLGDFLAELQSRNGIPRLVVVAHSMGGLVARGALLQLKDQGAGRVPLFVTISTPWQGHPGAGAGVEHSPVIMPTWYDMAPGSEFLKTLAAEPLPAEMDYVLFFGYRGGSAMFADGNTDGTLPLASMLDLPMQDRASRTCGFDETHAGILDSAAVSQRLNRELDAMAAPAARRGRH